MLFGLVAKIRQRRPKPAKSGRRLRFEPLEPRQMLSLNPTGFEQEMLEYINEMRIDPDDGLSRLVSNTNPLVATDSDVQSALDFFNVNGTMLASQFASLTPTFPLAWNESLVDAAVGHSLTMRTADLQTHQVLPDEPGLSARAVAEGYTGWTRLTENIYGYSDSAIFGHAGFAIDWGFGPGGMQTPAGHRENIMDATVREVGIGVVAGTPGNDLNPWIVTQDFGNRSAINGSVYVVGVLYDDTNTNDFYNAGEGVGGATVTVDGPGGTFVTSTMTAGGYQALVPQAGGGATYTVTFSGGGLVAPIVQVVQVSTQNVKVDGVVGAALGLTLDATSVGEGSTVGATITRSGNTGSALTVNLASSNPSEATVPATVIIPVGQVSATFQISGVTDTIVEENVLATITASAAGFSQAQEPVTVTDTLPSGFSLSGNVLTINGTAGNDSFSFTPGTSLHAVNRNGTDYQVSTAVAQQVVLQAMGGNDTVTATGSAGYDVARIRPTWTQVDGDNYQLRAYGVEQATVLGSAADYAYFYDSAGNEQFTASPTTAQMVGSGFTHSANGFGRYYAYATAGGTADWAHLFDSAGNDNFTGTSTYGRLEGTGFFLYASGFEQVYGYATAGGTNDVAVLYDSVGDDTFVGRPEWAQLDGTGFLNKVSGFDQVYAYSANVGTDYAYLYDSIGNDRLTARPTYSILEGDSFYNYANGFDRVYAYSTTGGTADFAYMYDSAGNDRFIGRPTSAQMDSTEYFNLATSFDRVYAYSTAGGFDQSFQYDSAGNDTFVGRHTFGLMYGSDYYNLAFYFDESIANASAGGTLDRAYLYDSSGDDVFTTHPTWSRM
ncbi:MAG TPA: CAP domain-containing protein, partial [Pirellulales bacterium]|nr:CAP domain-containing protein [Pirellulales bacterium]